MKRVIGLVVMFVAASYVTAAGAPATKPAGAHAAPKMTAAQRAAAKQAAQLAAIKLLAPADEYFGPLKQSVIGMRNQIRILGWNYDVNHDIAHQTYASASLTERAVRDWASKYPKDGQVPRTIFLLQRLYTKVLSQESRDHAHAIAMWLLVSYASSPQAKQMKKTLASEHLAPLPTPSPAPTPTYPSAFGTQYPSQFGSTPLPSPSASPSGAAAQK